MKNILIVLLLACLGAVSLVAFKQYQRYRLREAQVQALQVQAEQARTQAAELEREKEREARKAENLVKLSEELGTALKEVQARTNQPAMSAESELKGEGEGGIQALGGGDQKRGGFGKLLASMMEDPDIKNMIRDQQRGMVDQMYDPLIKDLKLTPEEATKLKDLVLDHMGQSTEKATSLFGDPGGTNRSAAVQEMVAQQKQLDDKVKEMLGEERYGQYKDYQGTMGERTQLSAFQQQLGAERALSPEQTSQLLKVMKEERDAVAASTGQPLGSGAGQEAQSIEAMMSEEQSAKLLESQELVNQKVLDRAGEVLSPEQLQSFGSFQTNQMRMMRMGLNMARKFLAPDKGGAAGQPGN